MSTLLLVMALSGVPGHAPAGCSSEVLTGGRLDQKGSLWVGSIEYPPGWEWPAVYADGVMTVTKKDAPPSHVRCRFIPFDRGRMEVRSDQCYPGIWKQEGKHIVVSLRVEGNTRPVDFKPSRSQQVITLRCVK